MPKLVTQVNERFARISERFQRVDEDAEQEVRHPRGTFIPIGGMNQDGCTPHAAIWVSITTARWSAWPTASSPWSALTQKLRGRPDAAPDGAALAACASLLGRPLSHLPPTREPQAVGSVSSEGVTKYY